MDTPPPAPGHRPLVVAGLVALVALVVHLPVLDDPFSVFDDRAYVTANPQVRAGLTPGSLAWALTGHAVGHWHPLTWASHMLDWQLWGADPAGHHLTSLLLHALACGLATLAVARLTGGLAAGAVVGLLVAVHPVHVETVAWIAERKGVLSAVFFWAVLLAYSGYAAGPSRAGAARVLVLFALGLAAKPMLVTLPCVLLLLDLWPLRRWVPGAGGAGALLLVLEKLPLFALSAAAAAVVTATQTADGARRAVALGDRLAHALVALSDYLVHLVRPTRLAAFYPHPGAQVSYPRAAAALLLLAALAAAAAWTARARPWFAVGLAWFLGVLVPVLGLVQVGSQGMADRYAYLAYPGLYLALAVALFPPGAGSPGRLRPALAAGVLVALAFQARVQLGYWQSPVALFRQATAVTRENYRAYALLGVALAAEGHLEEAGFELAESLRIMPDDPAVRAELGRVLARRGRLDAARAELEEALRLRPGDPDLWVDLGYVHGVGGKAPEAVRCFEEALRLAPGHAAAARNLTVARSQAADPAGT